MPRPTRAAFSLVELLVVIALIAVLMAILLPALNKARQAAQSVVCMTHLRQVMSSVFLYASDNDGAMVPAEWNSANGATHPYPTNYPTWAWLVAPSDTILLGKYTDPQSGSKQYIFGYIPTGNTVWRCPTARADSDYWKTRTSYAMNRNAGPYIIADATHPTGWERGYKISVIRSPARMMAFVDSSSERFDTGSNGFIGNPGGIGWNYVIGTPGAYYNHAIRHPGNTTNVSFMDGHVTVLSNTPQGADLGLLQAKAEGQFVITKDEP